MKLLDADNFYPRPPRGGRPVQIGLCGMGGQFLSTSSARRTTRSGRLFPPPGAISIHVLREEDDAFDRYCDSICARISIHVLREEDDCTPHSFCCRTNKISIHVLREEDDVPALGKGIWDLGISIHVLREEDDRHDAQPAIILRHFYPRPPRGGRRAGHRPGGRQRCQFLSTSSARRTTAKLLKRK